MAAAGKAIGLLHHAGNGNLGDEAALAAVIQGIKTRWPDAEIVGLSMNPSDTRRRHGIPSYPIRYWTWSWWGSPSPDPSGATIKETVKAAAGKHPVVFKLLRALYSIVIRIPRTVLGELLLLARSFRLLRSLDLLIICGGQQLVECSGGSWKFLGPWKFPFTIFKWIFAAKICRVKCLVLNVGAAPLVRPLSRKFVRGLLTLADYVSFRDEQSKAKVRNLNFTAQTAVVCDNAYLLETPSVAEKPGVEPRGKGIVGVAPADHGRDRVSYNDLLKRLAAFGKSLLQDGYSLRLFCADIRNDPPVVQDLEKSLSEDDALAQANSSGLLLRMHQWTTEDLLRNMSRLDFVIACRFETVVFAHRLNLPVLAISDQPEVRALMNDLGLAEYCVESGNCNREVLAGKFSSLVNKRDEIKRRMAEKLAVYRRELAVQFDELFPPQAGQSGLSGAAGQVGRRFGWLAQSGAANAAAACWKIARGSLLGFANQLQRWPRDVLGAMALLMVLAIGVVDYVTGFEASVSVFYLPAIGLAAWSMGRGPAILVSILSVTVSLFTDVAGGARFSSPLLPLWNGGILLSMYLAVVGLLGLVRSLQREVEARVQQRPAGLGHEHTSIPARRLSSAKGAAAGFWTPPMSACITTALIMVALAGVVDYVTGIEVSCSAFYLPAIALAAWFVGGSFAFFISLLSVIASLFPYLTASGHFSSALIPAWNAGMVLSTYFVVVGLLASARSLQRQVQTGFAQDAVTVAPALCGPAMAMPSGLANLFAPEPGDCSEVVPHGSGLMQIPVMLLAVCQWILFALSTVLVLGYLALSRWIWRGLPAFVRGGAPGLAYGRHLHSLACWSARRKQNHSTFFLRNRPELELLCRLLEPKTPGASLNLTVFACSKGAEVYSILWAIRSARPDLNVRTNAVDISQEILEFAERGEYSLQSRADLKSGNKQGTSAASHGTWKDQPVSIFERMTATEMQTMFEVNGDRASVRPWLRQDITWQVGDAGDPEFVRALGSQDVVVANRFLCHMDPEAAERCLRNIARAVKPGGYLFVSGIDLGVRTKVARSLGWKPIDDLLQEVHEGDVSLRNAWPFQWWAVEPFSRNLPDWRIRYASAFQLGEPA